MPEYVDQTHDVFIPTLQDLMASHAADVTVSGIPREVLNDARHNSTKSNSSDVSRQRMNAADTNNRI